MDLVNRPHGRRAVIVGAAGIGLASIVGGSLVHAQTTPEAGDATPTDETTPEQTDRSAEAAARYDDFVSKLATNLGNTDPTAVDTAIRTSLTTIVDERLAAGEISANDADAAKTAIASSPAPIFGIFAGTFRGGGRDGGRWGRTGGPGFGGRFCGDSDTGTDTDTNDSTPAASI